jgi:hypothetical protein
MIAVNKKIVADKSSSINGLDSEEMKNLGCIFGMNDRVFYPVNYFLMSDLELFVWLLVEKMVVSPPRHYHFVNFVVPFGRRR